MYVCVSTYEGEGRVVRLKIPNQLPNIYQKQKLINNAARNLKANFNGRLNIY